MKQFDVAIVGSGFSGSVLARCLNARGRSVVLIERHRHPRFAIGESSTPLAAIALERLAAAYDLADLDALAAYGRWTENFPEVRRGLKRGFTFYSHTPGEPLSPAPATRLLVAASPNDRVADCHWLRSDVDTFLVDKAIEEGVDYRDLTEIDQVSAGHDCIELSGRDEHGGFTARADFVVDASGPSGVVARHLGAVRRSRPARFRSSVVFSHFSGVESLARIWADDGLDVEPGPYPDERAAVHHLLKEGWMYVLPFDHGCVSAGVVFDGRVHPDEGERVWQQILEAYPTIGRQFEASERSLPMMVFDPLQYRLSTAAGQRWAALPFAYSFLDPMFSTGIAWSLESVERLAAILADGPGGAVNVDEYARRMAAEADQMERLIYGAHLARSDFDVFAAHSQLYFALVSFEEVRQRIFETPESDVWSRRFLGGGDEWAEQLLSEAVARLERWVTNGRREDEGAAYAQWVSRSIASRNVAGLADPARGNLYPVDLDVLVERSHLLGLRPDEMLSLLPKLRGERIEVSSAS